MASLPLFALQLDSDRGRVPPWVWFRRSRVTRGRVHFFLRGFAFITSFRPRRYPAYTILDRRIPLPAIIIMIIWSRFCKFNPPSRARDEKARHLSRSTMRLLST